MRFFRLNVLSTSKRCSWWKFCVLETFPLKSKINPTLALNIRYQNNFWNKQESYSFLIWRWAYLLSEISKYMVHLSDKVLYAALIYLPHETKSKNFSKQEPYCDCQGNRATFLLQKTKVPLPFWINYVFTRFWWRKE